MVTLTFWTAFFLGTMVGLLVPTVGVAYLFHMMKPPTPGRSLCPCSARNVRVAGADKYLDLSKSNTVSG